MRPGLAITRMLLAAAGCFLVAGAGAQEAGEPLVLQGAIVPGRAPEPRAAPRRQKPARAAVRPPSARPSTPAAAQGRPGTRPEGRSSREAAPRARPAAPRSAEAAEPAAARPAPVRAGAPRPVAPRGPKRPAAAARVAPRPAPASSPARAPAPEPEGADWAKAVSPPPETRRPAPAPLPPLRPPSEEPEAAEREAGPLLLGVEAGNVARREVLDAVARAAGQPVRWAEEPGGPAAADLVLASTLELRRAEPGGGARFAAVAKLFIERAVLLAPPETGGVDALAGRPLAVAGAAARLLADPLFHEPGRAPRPVVLPLDEALAELRAGRVAGLLTVTHAPASVLARAAGCCRPLPVAFTEALRAAGLYPAVIEPAEGAGAQPVETVAVGTVLAAALRPGDRAQEGRLAAFVDGFFSNLDALAREDPRWREVNVAAAAPWPRLEAARLWLAARGVRGLEGPQTRAGIQAEGR